MQYDLHVWEWRAWLFWKTGQMIHRIKLDDDGGVRYVWIDPREVYVS